jgi:hypothetical protein
MLTIKAALELINKEHAGLAEKIHSVGNRLEVLEVVNELSTFCLDWTDKGVLVFTPLKREDW